MPRPTVPRRTTTQRPSLSAELVALRRPAVLLVLGVVVLGASGMFAFYTFITPTLTAYRFVQLTPAYTGGAAAFGLSLLGLYAYYVLGSYARWHYPRYLAPVAIPVTPTIPVTRP